jgi:hypothetical protein
MARQKGSGKGKKGRVKKSDIKLAWTKIRGNKLMLHLNSRNEMPMLRQRTQPAHGIEFIDAVRHIDGIAQLDTHNRYTMCVTRGELFGWNEIKEPLEKLVRDYMVADAKFEADREKLLNAATASDGEERRQKMLDLVCSVLKDKYSFANSPKFRATLKEVEVPNSGSAQKDYDSLTRAVTRFANEFDEDDYDDSEVEPLDMLIAEALASFGARYDFIDTPEFETLLDDISVELSGDHDVDLRNVTLAVENLAVSYAAKQRQAADDAGTPPDLRDNGSTRGGFDTTSPMSEQHQE